MPVKGGTQTPQERAFIDAYVASGDTIYAGTKAGYSQPGTSASKALARPAIQAEIVRIQTERLFNELLPLAVEAHIDLLRNPCTPAGARVQAVKLVYDKTLGGQEGEGKEPHEMTANELARALDKLRREASERAKPVIEHEATPSVFA